MNYNVAGAVTRFVASVLVVILICAVTIMGFAPLNIPGIFDTDGITLGLDLAGGSLIVYEAKTDLTGDELKMNMDSVEALIRSRLDTLGFNEAAISTSGNQVSVEIPSITDPEEAIQKIGATANLQFRDDAGNVLVEGKHVKRAVPQYGAYDSTGVPGYFVVIEFTDEGRELFKIATGKLIDKNISIYLDEDIQSTAVVQEEIDDNAIISGKNFTSDEVKWLASVINAGQLPFALEAVQQDSVGASLGEKSLDTAIVAGIVGLLLVMLFMILIYKVPGIVASISLVAYTALVLITMEITKTNLTLPGIAGVILSIGMAVDANVVIYERIKEELAAGKSIKAAVEAGFDRAFTAIFDSNVTTIISAAALWYFGSGPVKGFGATLFYGVLISMFTALTLTKYFLRLTIKMQITNPALYGYNADKSNKKSILDNFNVLKYRKAMLVLVAVITVLGIGTIAIRGFNVDVDFEGGTEFQISLNKNIEKEDISEIEKIVADTIGDATLISSINPSVTDDTTVVIRTKLISDEQRADVRKNIISAFDLPDDVEHSVRSIGASISENLKRNSIISAVISIVLMLAYVSFRFSFLSSFTSILCLMHDLFIMIVFYSLLQIPVNSNIVAALLTILGFSDNSTIVIFDRIREEMKKRPTASFDDCVNVGVRTSVVRSFNTVFATLITITMIFIFGVASVRNFALPIIIGLVAGLFSSIMLAGPVWALFRSKLGDISLSRLIKNMFGGKKKAKTAK
ncbi:MAG: protein translocase subunit SecD [Eubacteriales bacterium]|nr:protein translocase subunit SecD [Eubacteriales bacterium]MDD4476201.1 protein translocase subunit SecD [Eubacteriales bacterium]